MLLQSWKQALDTIRPAHLSSFFVETLFIYKDAFITLIRFFWWALLADGLLFLLFSKTLLIPLPSQPPALAAPLLYIITATFWFIITIGLLLAIRKKGRVVSSRYFLLGFLHYVALSFFVSFLLLFAFFFLINFNITAFPSPSWYASFFTEMPILVFLFYWLDFKLNHPPKFIQNTSPFFHPLKTMHLYLKDALIALERALNFFLYNVPFFLILLLGKALFFFALSMLITQKITFASNIISYFFTTSPPGYAPLTNAAPLTLLAIKYLKFFINYFFISILFVFYTKRKHVCYVPYVFK